MSNIVALLIVLVASVVDRAQAVTCYRCIYTLSSQNEYICGAPSTSEANQACNGSICSWQFSDYASTTSKSSVAPYYAKGVSSCIRCYMKFVTHDGVGVTFLQLHGWR